MAVVVMVTPDWATSRGSVVALPTRAAARQCASSASGQHTRPHPSRTPSSLPHPRRHVLRRRGYFLAMPHRPAPFSHRSRGTEPSVFAGSGGPGPAWRQPAHLDRQIAHKRARSAGRAQTSGSRTDGVAARHAVGPALLHAASVPATTHKHDSVAESREGANLSDAGLARHFADC